jgi:hypothetical protein
MEHLIFDGIVFKNTAENIHDSWCDDGINGAYNPTIASAMHHHRFLEIRRNQKINDNQMELLHDHPNHDPLGLFGTYLSTI